MFLSARAWIIGANCSRLKLKGQNEIKGEWEIAEPKQKYLVLNTWYSVFKQLEVMNCIAIFFLLSLIINNFNRL